MYHLVSIRLKTVRHMPISINGDTVYRIGEALDEAGVSRATFFRWVKQGRIADTRYRDRNGARVFTVEEVKQLKQIAGRLVESSPQLPIPNLR